MSPDHVLIFGNGYVAGYLANSLIAQGVAVSITSRSAKAEADITQRGANYVPFGSPLPQASHAVATAPPDHGLDPVLATYGSGPLQQIPWVGYLSTTGVYGNCQGQAVTEEAPLQPLSDRATARVTAEQAWREGVPQTTIFRLSGIYGPGRNPLVRLPQLSQLPNPQDGPVNRIHVMDIVHILLAAMTQSVKGEVFNVADDDPAPTYATYQFAAQLQDMPLQHLPVADPKPLGAMGDGNRIAVNDKLKQQLGITLSYPSYRQGLLGLLA